MTLYLVSAEWSGVVEVNDNDLGPDAEIAAARDWLMDCLDLSDLARGTIAEAISPEKAAAEQWEPDATISVTQWNPTFGIATYTHMEEEA